MARDALSKIRSTLILARKLLASQDNHLTTESIKNQFNCDSAMAKQIFWEFSDKLSSLCVVKNLDNGLGKITESLRLADSKIKNLAYSDVLRNIGAPDLVWAEAMLKLNSDILGDDISRALTGLINNIGHTNNISNNIPFYGLQTKGLIEFDNYKEFLISFITAINEKKVCVVEYHRSYKTDDSNNVVVKDDKNTFFFAPLSIVSSNQKIYVEGYKGQISKNRLIKPEERTLLLNRVASVKVEDIPVGAELTIQKRENGDFFGFILTEPKPFVLEANFAPRLKEYVMERKWPLPEGFSPYEIKPSSRKSLYKGWIKLKMRCGDKRETLGWLLSFGSEVAIISPLDLKYLYLDELNKMLEVSGRYLKDKSRGNFPKK